MKLQQFSTIIIFVFSLLILTSALAKNKKSRLTLFNWAGNIDPAVIKSFEKEYSVKVHELFFNANEDRDQYLIENGIDNIDIVVVDSYKIDTYFKRNWLAKFDSSQMPELKHIDPKLSNNFSHLKNYAVPYMWGTMGLAYRSDLVKEPIKSWKQVFEPAKELQGKILMSGDSFELLGAALLVNNLSMNNINEQSLQQAQNALSKQKAYVYEYATLGVDKNVHLLSGDVWVAQAYNGDALMQQEKNEHIQYVLPEEGCAIWYDFMVILKKSKQKQLAQKFINYINKPQHAAMNSNFIWFATPNLEARKYIDKEVLENPLVFPADETVAKCEHQAYPKPQILRQINMIYHQITR